MKKATPSAGALTLFIFLMVPVIGLVGIFVVFGILVLVGVGFRVADFWGAVAVMAIVLYSGVYTLVRICMMK